MARMERLATTFGPAVCTPVGRMHFFVLPGAGAKVPELVRHLGWPPGALDLTVHGEGAWVAAPPTRLGARGSVQWASHPSTANRWLPDAETVLPALTYACASSPSGT